MENDNYKAKSHLFEKPPVIGCDDMAVFRGGASDDVLSETVKIALIGSISFHFCTGTMSQAYNFPKSYAFSFDFLQRLTTVQH